MPPKGSDLVLATHVPYCEADILVFYGLHVEPNGGNCRNNFPKLQFVEYSGLPCSIQTDHQDPHLFLPKKTA
uniref:Uncharacterized protein n=1 Tax=Anguilla anguilla TaxID=7936 RepID=A0A0E9PNC3_ANGAN